MNVIMRSLLVLLIVFCLGCETMQAGGSGGSSGGAPAASSSGGSKKMLTDADYKRLGIKETYEDR